MITVHQAKISAAIDCIREHVSHVDSGARCYATRDEALAAARDTISKSGQLDSSQIEEAFREFEKLAKRGMA